MIKKINNISSKEQQHIHQLSQVFFWMLQDVQMVRLFSLEYQRRISFSKHFGSRISMKIRAGFRERTMLNSCCSKMILYTEVNYDKKGGAENLNCHDLFTDKIKM
ncbi:MAG: hypothetical protein P9M03_10175 [Candidatus Theseobacter exili]|nr:hypothetical protein [Candidatus Theseobacter exili]